MASHTYKKRVKKYKSVANPSIRGEKLEERMEDFYETPPKQVTLPTAQTLKQLPLGSPCSAFK